MCVCVCGVCVVCVWCVCVWCVCVCVVVYSRGISEKSPDSGPGDLASLGCHACGECTKLNSLI